MNFTANDMRARIAKRDGRWSISLLAGEFGWVPLPISFTTLAEAWAFVDHAGEAR